jgi:hypothetical protein
MSDTKTLGDYAARRMEYLKKGTCEVRIVFDGTTNVKASDSPQYNDGKERIPVAYTV